MMSIGYRLAPPLTEASVALMSMRRFYNVMRLTIAHFESRMRERVTSAVDYWPLLLLFLTDKLYLVV